MPLSLAELTGSTMGAARQVARAQEAGIPTEDIEAIVGGRARTGEELDILGAQLGQAAGLQEAQTAAGESFGEFVEADIPDWLAQETAQRGALRRGVASGRAAGMGALARRGLLGTGAEAGLETYTGSLLGRGAAEIERDISMAQMDFNTLQQSRRNAFNQAKAMFEAGNAQAAAQLMAEYDRMTAELSARREEGGGFWSAVGAGAGAFLGGPGGAEVARGIGGLFGGGEES